MKDHVDLGFKEILYIALLALSLIACSVLSYDEEMTTYKAYVTKVCNKEFIDYKNLNPDCSKLDF